MVIIKVALLPHLLRPRQRRYKEKKIQGLQAWQLNGLASPPTSTALGSQVRSGSSWPLSGNCTEKQLPTDTPRPTASFGPCHRPRVPRRACVEPRPWSRQAPGGLPSGVWYTPEAAPLPARAGKEARGPLDSGSLPSRRSKPLSQPSAEIPVSWHLARSGTEEIGLFRALTFIASDHIA